MGRRIMVVDDSRVVHLQIKKLFEGTDYEVAAYCQTGEAAISQYSQIKPDLITMDIIMPGLDGLETAQTILRTYPEAKIVMVSSLAYDDTIHEAEALGIHNFIYKPFDRNQLLATLDKAFQEAYAQ